MSTGFLRAVENAKKIRGFKRQAEEASQGGLALGGGLAAGLTLSLKSYADQENAATGLKVAMMDANGEVGKRFQDINKLAIGLGNQLPGTTADFQNMMQMLVRQDPGRKHSWRCG